MLTIDYIIVFAGWLLGNIIFNNFEKHLSWERRVIKFTVTVGVLCIVGYFFGRTALYGILALMGIGMGILHIWWFPKNGINGFTAEPYGKYLKFIDRIQGGRLSGQPWK